MGISKPASLGHALFSSAQLRVLGVLFGQPNRSFRVTDVIRLASSGAGAVQRELKKLAAAQLIEFKPDKTYQANSASPIFRELKSIIRKTVGLLDPLRDALAPFKSKISFAFVYGSIAKGTDTAKSDVDLMIVGEDVSYSDVFLNLEKAERALLRPVNPTILTNEEWVKRLSQRSTFLSKVVQQPKLFVIGNDDDLKRV
jgi:predicted nucleotidyltransferase